MSKTSVTESIVVTLKEEPVELYRILKFEGLVDSGGQAKFVIAAGEVKVNGATETRKRKKVVAGDVIEFNNYRLTINASKPLA